jgi:hypothetical protein
MQLAANIAGRQQRVLDNIFLLLDRQPAMLLLLLLCPPIKTIWSRIVLPPARLLSAGCCDGGGRAAATAAAHSYFSHYPRIAGHQCVNPIARMFMSQIAVIICLALVGSANVVVAGKCSDHVLSMKADGGWSGFDGEESGSSNQYGKAYISSFLPLMFPGMFSLAAGRMCILYARV